MEEQQKNKLDIKYNISQYPFYSLNKENLYVSNFTLIRIFYSKPFFHVSSKAEWLVTEEVDKKELKDIILPIKTYDNIYEMKAIIFKDNKNKSFVYRWINKINGKEYLGSTSNSKRRLLTYYDDNSLKISKMPIYNAILKYGRNNFSFEI